MGVFEEYWFERFRKAVLIETSSGKLLVDYDVYAKKSCEELGCNVTNAVSMGEITMYYCEVPVSRLTSKRSSRQAGIDVSDIVEKLVLVALKYKCGDKECWEIVNARAVMKKPREASMKSIVEELYRMLVWYLEDRDIDVEPLYPNIETA